MKLSVVILNYNVRFFLELCLQSVQAGIQDIDAEIIVVDNNSEDDSCQMVKSQFPNVVLIENNENLGFSKGNNIGVAKTKGEYICILNPDTVVAEDTFHELLTFADKQKQLGIVGCRLIDGKGKYLPESKRNVPIVTVAFQKMLGNSSKYYANHLSEFEIGKVDVLVGAFMFMKKNVYTDLKGFDEDYFMYGEDIDLSYKAIKANYNNYYFGETSIIHFKGESTLKDKTYAKRFYKAMQIFYKKHFKKNVLFDSLVWLGIVLAYNVRKGPKSIKSNSNEYIFVTNNDKGILQNVLNRKINVSLDLKDVHENSEVIFDANYLSFKEIIKYMSLPEINLKATFKILPKMANFVLGSNDSKNRGEVIKFENNLKKTSKIH